MLSFGLELVRICLVDVDGGCSVLALYLVGCISICAARVKYDVRVRVELTA